MLYKLFSLVLFVVFSTNTFSQDFRLVATHTTNFGNNGNWDPVDSTRYVYLGNFGGIEPYAELKYDTSRRLGWNGGIYFPNGINTRTINGNGWIMETFYYETEGIVADGDYKDVFTRDGNGNITEELWQIRNNGNWENYGRKLRSWDGNDNLLTEETQDYVNNGWEPEELLVYQYDVNNNSTKYFKLIYNTGTSQFDSNVKVDFYYNINNQRDSSISYTWATGWAPNSRQRHNYTNGVNTYTILSSWDNNANNWKETNQYFNFINTNNIVIGDSLLGFSQTTNSWVHTRRSVVTLDGNNRPIVNYVRTWNNTNGVYTDYSLDTTEYNPDGLVSRRKLFRWNFSNSTWGYPADYDQHYYYEGYTSGVKNMSAPSIGSLIVYPTPAYGNINISMKWKEAEDFKVLIYDVQGRLVRQIGEKATKEYHKDIPLYDLAPGTYTLQIKGKSGSVQERFIIAN